MATVIADPTSNRSGAARSVQTSTQVGTAPKARLQRMTRPATTRSRSAPEATATMASAIRNAKLAKAARTSRAMMRSPSEISPHPRDHSRRGDPQRPGQGRPGPHQRLLEQDHRVIKGRIDVREAQKPRRCRRLFHEQCELRTLRGPRRRHNQMVSAPPNVSASPWAPASRSTS